MKRIEDMTKDMTNDIHTTQHDGPQQGEIILYQPDETVRLEVRLEDDTVWLNRQQLAELFGRDVKTIGKHVNNALKEELKDISVIAKFATTARDGKTYQVDYYNLDMVLSVGYRVKSSKGVQFRTWANKVIRNYLLRGYSINYQMRQLEQKLDSQQAEIKDIKQTLADHLKSGWLLSSTVMSGYTTDDRYGAYEVRGTNNNVVWITDGTYVIMNRKIDYCRNDKNPPNLLYPSGSDIKLNHAAPDAIAQWEITVDADGYYTFKNVHLQSYQAAVKALLQLPDKSVLEQFIKRTGAAPR